MSDLELNALAEGIFKYLLEKSETPLDGIAILGMALCMIYDNAGGSEPFPAFAKAFHDSLIETQRNKSAPGTESIQ